MHSQLLRGDVAFRPLKILRKILNGYVAREKNDFILGISRIFSSGLSLRVSCAGPIVSFEPSPRSHGAKLERKERWDV